MQSPIPPAARSVVRSNRVLGPDTSAVRNIELQDGIRFAGAERVVREAVESSGTEPRAASDLTPVQSFDGGARRVLLEAVRRLALDEREVYPLAPERTIANLCPRDGGKVAVVRSAEDFGV